MVVKEEVTFEESKVKEASKKLKKLALKFLNLYLEQEKLEKEMNSLKEEMVDLYKEEDLKTIPIEDQGFEVQCREKNTFTWDEKNIFSLVSVTKYADMIFPKTVDKDRLTEEDLRKVGLYEKCLTRKFDPKAMEELLAKKIFDLNTFLKDSLLKVKTSHYLARCSIKKGDR